LGRHWRRSKIKTHAEANLFLEKASGEENAPQDTFFQSVYSATGTPYFLIQARNTPAAAQIVSSFPIRARVFPLASSTMFSWCVPWFLSTRPFACAELAA